MNNLNILLVEDNAADVATFRSSVELFDADNNVETNLIVSNNYADAKQQILDNVFDGIILDLALERDKEGGREILDFIFSEKIIVPVIVHTATPDELREFDFIDVQKKGDREGLINSILIDLKETKECGINDLFNVRGEIQEFLKEVFYKNIYYQKKNWISNPDKAKVKKAILRHTLNHLNQHIDQADNKYFLEEMYIYPPIAEYIKPGSIIQNKDSKIFYIVLTPACELAQAKARCIILAEIIDPERFVSLNLPGNGVSGNRTTKLKNFIDNKKQDYHFLPKMNYFMGGFIDFTSINSYSMDELQRIFTETKVQISPFFINDILARFSSYYARQGQPDLYHSEGYVNELLSKDIRPKID